MDTPITKAKALVLLSGGQDSTTCLFWAKQAYDPIALTIAYGQRHALELQAARKVAELAQVQHHELSVGKILMGASPLINMGVAVGHYAKAEDMPGGVEPTFVPGRNILFLTIAANWAVAHGAEVLVIGVSQEDYGGYPDCRAAFINRMRQALNQGLFGRETGNGTLEIATPLLQKTKKQTVEMAVNLPGCWDALAFSHTCYDGQYPPNPNNHASILRARGFKEAGLGDPLILRAKAEGLLPAEYPDHGLLVGA